MKPYQSKTKMDELQHRARELAKLHTYAIHAEWNKQSQTLFGALVRDTQKRELQTITDEELFVFQTIACQFANSIHDEAEKRGLIPPLQEMDGLV